MFKKIKKLKFINLALAACILSTTVAPIAQAMMKNYNYNKKHANKNKQDIKNTKFLHSKTKFKPVNKNLILKKELQSHESTTNQNLLRHQELERSRAAKQQKNRVNNQKNTAKYFDIEDSNLLILIIYLTLLTSQVRASAEYITNYIAVTDTPDVANKLDIKSVLTKYYESGDCEFWDREAKKIVDDIVESIDTSKFTIEDLMANHKIILDDLTIEPEIALIDEDTEREKLKNYKKLDYPFVYFSISECSERKNKEECKQETVYRGRRNAIKESCKLKRIKPFRLFLDHLVFDPATVLGLKINKSIKSPTLIYLSDPVMRKAVVEHCTYTTKVCKNLIEFILKNELLPNNKDTVAFYHANNGRLLLFQDFLIEFSKLKNKEDLEDNIPVRINNKDFLKGTSKNTRHFLDNEKRKWEGYNGIGFDHRDEIKKYLLAVNLPLFGNIYNDGECTLYYFLRANSNTRLDMSNLKEIFDHFGYDKCFETNKEMIVSIREKLARITNFGILLQIFIPKELINELTYPSLEYGRPIIRKIIEKNQTSDILLASSISPKEPTHEYFPSSDAINNFKEKITAAEGRVDLDTQFRILINDKMLDPKSGIKIFRFYNKNEKIERIREEIKNIVSSCEKESEEENRASESSLEKDSLTRTEPFFSGFL